MSAVKVVVSPHSHCHTHPPTTRCAEDVDRYMEVRSQFSEGAKKGVQWLENQSNVLEEVDQLVELMATEKAGLSRRITRLKDEVKGLKKREFSIEDENTKLKIENINKQSFLAIQEEKSAKLTGALRETLAMTEARMEDLKNQVESLNIELEHSRANANTLSVENMELKEKIKKNKCDYASISSSLEVRCSENTKLTHSLSSMREQCRKLRGENAILKERKKEVDEKLHAADNMILAMKGRATSCRKLEERLRGKISCLEEAVEVANSRPPTIIHVPCQERSRTELKLIKDCKSKDEALASCTHALSACEAEHKRQQLHKKFS